MEEKELMAAIEIKMADILKKFDEKAEASEIEKLKFELEALRAKATQETNDKLQKSYDDLNEVQVKFGEKLAAIEVSGNSLKTAENLADVIVKAYKDNLEKIKSNTSGMMNFELKSAGTMAISTNYSGGTVGLSSLEQGITRIQRRSPFIRQIVNSAGTTSKYVVWIEQANADGGAGLTAEGTAKTQADFDLVEASMQTRKITAYIKVSKEMLADVPFVEGEIRNELIELIQLKLDSQILTGDGLTNNMKGIVTYATAYAAGNFANTINNANNFDVLRTAMSQIETANFMPNYIVMNPEDVAVMELNKSALTGDYVMPPFSSVDGTTVKGLPVVANTGVTAGTFLVGDFTKSNLRIREDVNLQVGYENDDFTKNLVTILAEARAVHYVKSNQTTAFVYGTFATAIAALETP
jgi:HK97 family phage major capsid protein